MVASGIFLCLANRMLAKRGGVTMKKIRNQKRERSVALSAGIGISVAALVSMVCVGALTFLISGDSLPLSTAVFAMPAVQLLSAFAGCLIAGQTVSTNKSVTCGVVCASYYVLLVGVSALFMQGISGAFWVGILMTALGCLAAMFLSAREKSSAGKKKRKRTRG